MGICDSNIVEYESNNRYGNNGGYGGYNDYDRRDEYP